MRNVPLLLTVWLSLLLVISAPGCTQDKGSHVAKLSSSGEREFDRTAAYASHLIDKVKGRMSSPTPSRVLEYIFSTAGSAELTPPNPDTEPSAAAAYKGPRPSPTVWLQSAERERNPMFKEHLLLAADDERGTIAAEAYKEDEEEPFYTWEFALKE